MSYLVAIRRDGIERVLRGKHLQDLVLRCREWCRRNPWSPLTETDDGGVHPQLMAFLSEADIVGYGGAAGGGKGLALNTPLPTPTGWTTMGAVALGDTLFDDTGQPCTVTAISDLALRDCYRLTFDDGSTLVADDVHRWVTFDAKELSRFNSAWAQGGPLPQGTMRDTTELAGSVLTASGRRNHAVRMALGVSSFRYLVACEPVPTVLTKCISVDSASRMYLAGEAMIPTHNTDLACGLAITAHRKVMLLRRVGTELQGILDRLEELIGNTDGRNGQQKVWKRRRWDGVPQQIEWASLPNAGDERGFQGRPHDLLVFDEAANFLEGQVRFLLGWLRSTVKGQRKKALLTFNPPTTSEGRWIVDFFGPWLDDTHPDPAEIGELRWFATIRGKDVEVRDGTSFVVPEDTAGMEPQRVPRNYDYDPKDYRGDRKRLVIQPLSRTFIPSKINDNPYLADTGYMAMLQGLPEPLRSQMLNGDFKAGMTDSAWQVIPTAWVDAAQARWKPKDTLPEQDSLGVDVARGGGDETVISPRYGRWYAPLQVHEGKSTPDGQTVATLALMAMRDRAPIHIDVIGVGSSPYDILRDRKVQVIGVNVAEKALGTDKTGRLRFLNLRSELWWMMREALDPANNRGIQLPPDTKLKGDLCAPTWKLSGSTIQVEGREEIVKRIGRSVDRASALILAQLDTPKAHATKGALTGGMGGEYDPYAAIGSR